MGVYQFLGQSFLILIALGSFSTAANQLSFQVQCDFGDSYYLTKTRVKVNGSLTSQFSNARRCQVSHSSDSAIIRVTVRGFNSSSNLSALYSMVLENLTIQFVGVAQSRDLQNMKNYSFHACPRLDSGKTTEHDIDFLFFGAPANDLFAVEVELDNSVLPSGETAEFSVRSDGVARVRAFNIQEEQLFSLIQITVSSEESEMECLLVVSRSCSAEQSPGLSENNAGVENQTIQLTFTESGRITLSQYSRPKITTGRWYIGLRSKNVDKESAFEKTVKVTVAQGYKYDTIGKALPAGYMCLIAIFGGIAIGVFAHFFLNSDFDECSVPFHLENSDEISRARAPSRGIVDFVPKPIPRKTFPIKKWLEVICITWFCKGIKTYSYLTGVLAISFMVGSAQFVIARWSSMIKGGNRDLCYYNELCYRPIAIADMPSNFMLSNVPYVIHGIFLALSFSFREAITLQVNESKKKYVLSPDNKLFRPYDYSVAYALAWALVFEGLFSAMYHLCPSRLTFQFDSAFMFIISGLVVVALFNCRVNSEALMDAEEKEKKHPSNTTVQAPKYFLFFVAPLLVFNYMGSVRDTDGLTSFFEVTYWIALVIWLIAMYIWTFQKVGVPCKWKYSAANEDCWSLEAAVKWTWIIIFPLCLLIIGFKQKNDWSQFFLFSCVAAVALTILGLTSFDLVLSLKRQRSENGDCCGGIKHYCNPILIWKAIWRNWHRVLFMIATFIFWVFAMYFFKMKSTTRKVAAPSFSRSLNAECVLWDFFDYHDLWHMLSSFALLMSAYLLIYVTRKVEIYFWVERMYWKSRDTAHEASGGSTERIMMQIHDAGKENSYEIVEEVPLDKAKLRDKYDNEYASVSYV